MQVVGVCFTNHTKSRDILGLPPRVSAGGLAEAVRPSKVSIAVDPLQIVMNAGMSVVPQDPRTHVPPSRKAHHAMSRTPSQRLAAIRRLPAGLNRRALLSAGLGLVLAASLAACGGDSSSPTSAAGGGAGTVKWAWQLPTTWDPVTSSAGSDVQMLALTYSSLTHIDDQGNAVPNLADSWKYNDDGTAVTFKLKDCLLYTSDAADE